MVKTTKQDVYCTEDELEKAPVIKMFYPAETAYNNYFFGTPDTSKFGEPVFGWAN